jgi:hypothetical protein
MFNFSANNLVFISIYQYDKYNSFILKDRDTNRCYRLYDFSKSVIFKHDKLYCISGKVNSADKIYLVLNDVKEDKKNTLKF